MSAIAIKLKQSLTFVTFDFMTAATSESIEYFGAIKMPGKTPNFGYTSPIASIPFFFKVVLSVPPIISAVVTFEVSISL